MHNIIKVEFMKLKHNKLISSGMLAALLVPLLITMKDLFFNVGIKRVGMESWVRSIQTLVIFFMLPILSGFAITVIFQKEYSERTIINQLTAPVSRSKFILSKLFVWIVYHMALTIMILLTTYVGVFCLFSNEVRLNVLIQMGSVFLKSGFLNFIALIPLMVVLVLQKKLFYPSLLMCFLFTLVGVSGISMKGMFPFIFPWSAANVLSTIKVQGVPFVIGMSSIVISGVVGVYLSIYFFKKQNM